VQSEGANLDASGTAWIGQAASKKRGLTCKGPRAAGQRDCEPRSRARRPDGRAQEMPRNQRRIGRFLIDTAAIRNGCKLMKTNDGCTV